MHLTIAQIDKLIVLFVSLTTIIYLTPADTIGGFLRTLVHTSIAVLRHTGTALVYTSIFLGIGGIILAIIMLILSCVKPRWYKKGLGYLNAILTFVFGTPPPRDHAADSC